MNKEAFTRYATAKEYVEAIKLIITSPNYKEKHILIATRPSHLLADFAVELYLKSWLLADGMDAKAVQKMGHKLRDLWEACRTRNFADNQAIYGLVDHIAEAHGQTGDYVYRYTREDTSFEPLIWNSVLPYLRYPRCHCGYTCRGQRELRLGSHSCLPAG